MAEKNDFTQLNMGLIAVCFAVAAKNNLQQKENIQFLMGSLRQCYIGTPAHFLCF